MFWFFCRNHELISGGEDGVVNIWDLREKNPVHKITPHKNDKVARPELGKWIGAVSLNEDWLVSVSLQQFTQNLLFISNLL